MQIPSLPAQTPILSRTFSWAQNAWTFVSSFFRPRPPSPFDGVFDNPDLLGMIVSSDDRAALRGLAHLSKLRGADALQQYQILRNKEERICSEYHLEDCSSAFERRNLLFAMHSETMHSNEHFEWRRLNELNFKNTLKDICKNGCKSVTFIEGDEDWEYFELAKKNADEDTFRRMLKCTEELSHRGSRLNYLCLAMTGGALRNVKTLDLEGNMIGDAGIAEFSRAIASESLRALKHLLLAGNQIGDTGMAELSRAISSGSLRALEQLDLNMNQIGYAGMADLSRAITSKSLDAIKILDLGRNQIGNAGMTEFSRVARKSLGGLKELYLYGNQIGDDGMAEFSRAISSGSMVTLERLDLSGNQIGDAGMKAFAAASGALMSLETLSLWGNQIGDAGMAEFSRAIASVSMANLRYLDLQFNEIGDAGIKEFSRAIASGSLGALERVVVDTKHPQLIAACQERKIEIA